jgi:hypothetical protein
MSDIYLMDVNLVYIDNMNERYGKNNVSIEGAVFGYCILRIELRMSSKYDIRDCDSRCGVVKAAGCAVM